jgi:two-component system, NtrC family, sensor kinase
VRERAERASSAHAAAAPEQPRPEPVRPSLLQAVTELGWLAPRASSLAALCRPSARAVWCALRDDPGAVLLVLRRPAAKSHSAERSLSLVSLLEEPSLPLDALRYLAEAPSGFVAWDDPSRRPIYQAAVACARIAEQLALHTGHVDTDRAWIAGLLAPLGWFVVTAVAPAKAVSCLADSGLSRDAIETQLRHWGIDNAALARRVARRWKLPDWLTALVGHLGLPEATAQVFGAEAALYQVTRLAIGLARENGFELGLARPEWVAGSAAALDLSLAAATGLARATLEQPLDSGECWESPFAQPLLPDLLMLAAENRRLRGATLQEQLEGELDELQRALEERVRSEEQRLQAAKLIALAEFAAGAGHEINNPLAVISGQAQYLLKHERDWLASDSEGKAASALHTIIGQTKRVHSLLRDLMQFARPSPPRRVWFDLPTLLGEIAANLEEMARQRQVRVEIGPTPEKLPLLADLEQVRTALTCLLKNAIEAADVDGWARLRIVEPLGEHRVEIAVEDNGPGPDADQRDHLFDPFYSGRTAGRGRGLGLPLAWRLLRQQGGEIRLLPQMEGPTCFAVSLPRTPVPAGELAKHARNGTTVEC